MKITLKNGLRVANFNSPHEFKFDDGSVLPAVNSAFASATMLRSEDVETFNGKFTEVRKVFRMSGNCATALLSACKQKIDVLIVPLPVLLLTAGAPKELAENFAEFKNSEIKLIQEKSHTCFLIDRVAKICSSTKFCK